MRDGSLTILTWILILLALSTWPEAQSSERYERILRREAHAVMGLSAPVPMMAGQIQAESAWRPDVDSPVGAQGIAQFMPGTSRWMSELYPELGEPEPYNPHWAIRAMVRYDRWNYRRVKGATECDRWWAALRSYNGGLGHWLNEAKLASNSELRALVDEQCGKASRSEAHCPENLGYPRKILLRFQPNYRHLGKSVMCVARTAAPSVKDCNTEHDS